MKTKNFQKGEASCEKEFFSFFTLGVNHLGNVLQVVTDRKLAHDNGVYDPVTGLYSSATEDGIVDYFTADVVSQSDYYPFGMLMPGRNSSEDDYRYGFNGMEMDDEVHEVKGSSYDFGARLYNSRVGRFMSLDPVSIINPHESNYCFAGNNPIYFVDFYGEDNIVYLVVVPSDDPEVKKLDAQKIADEANKMYQTLGVQTRVVVFDESTRGKFNPHYMDKTDSYAVVADPQEIIDRTGLPLTGGALENADAGGNMIGTPYDNLDKYSVLPTTSVEQLVAFSIVHGSGHNAEPAEIEQHSELLDNDMLTTGKNYVNFMAEGGLSAACFDKDLKATYSSQEGGFIDVKVVQERNPAIKTLMDLFAPVRNKENIKNLQKRFGKNESMDNYDKNKEERGVKGKAQGTSFGIGR